MQYRWKSGDEHGRHEAQRRGRFRQCGHALGVAQRSGLWK